MLTTYLSELETKLRDGRIDRRTFMSHALAAGATVTAATAIADKSALAAPKKGGHFKLGKGHGETANTLDPGTADNGWIIGILFGYQGYLTEVGPDGSLQPGLAESWDASSDGATWTFKLRKGITFHDGRDITADDVIASINHHRGEESTSAAGPLVKPVKDMKADGKDTVVVSLEAGNADFPFILTDYHIPVMPAKDGKMDWQSANGAGAYKLDNYEAGIQANLSRYENHWDIDNRAWFESVDSLSLKDPNARTTALVTGDAHCIDRVDLKTAALLGRKPGVVIHSISGTQHFNFPMRCDTAPYDNVDVRLALKYGINRQEMVDKILFGYGQVGNDHPIGSGQRFHNKDLPQREYDPDKAKFHLKKAGMDSVSVALSASDAAFAGAVDAAVLYQNSAKGAGIDLKVVREPNDGYWADVWMKKGWVASYWSGRPVEDQMFSTAFQSGAAWNETFWSNEQFDQLLVAARAELDESKRRQMYYDMQEIVNMDGGSVIPMFASYVFALSDKIGTPDQMASNWDLDGERGIERWWFA